MGPGMGIDDSACWDEDGDDEEGEAGAGTSPLRVEGPHESLKEGKALQIPLFSCLRYLEGGQRKLQASHVPA